MNEEHTNNGVEVEVEVSGFERLTIGQLEEVVKLSGEFQRIKAEISELEEEKSETNEKIKSKKSRLEEIADRVTKLHLGVDDDKQLTIFDKGGANEEDVPSEETEDEEDDASLGAIEEEAIEEDFGAWDE